MNRNINIKKAALNGQLFLMTGINPISMEEIIALADSSKFDRRGFAFIAPIREISTVVTDKGIRPEHKSRLENMGVKVIVA